MFCHFRKLLSFHFAKLIDTGPTTTSGVVVRDSEEMMDAQGLDPDGEWMNNTGWSYFSFAQFNSLAPISCLHFDNIEDRLWTGSETGRVVSYLSSACQRHTAFMQPGPVRSIETFEGGVLSLTPSLLRAQTRSGLPIFSYSPEKFTSMQCMHQPAESMGHVYVGGDAPHLLHFDVESQRELRMAKLTQQKDVVIVRTNGKSVLTADTDGNIGVRDINSLDNARMLQCHGGPVMDFDVVGNQLISCGASFRAGAMHGDPYVKIYDLRTFRHLPPIPLSFSPFIARFLPSYSVGKIILISQQLCQVQLHDLNDNTGVPLLVESGGVPISSFAYAPSRQVMAFGDAAGNTHLYADREDAVLNETQVQPEFADIPTALPHSFNIDDVTHSLASIPLPFSFDDGYLSDWPEEYCEYAYRKPRPLPEYPSVRTLHHVQYAPNPRAGTPLARFHLCPYDDLESREVKEDSSSRDSDGVQTEEEVDGVVAVPRFYRPCVWKQTIKGGDETPSLLRFNRTSKVPIEYNNGANFANPLIQVLYSLPSLRNIFLHHLCHDDHCLSCQLGFLFRMMSDREPSQPASSNNLMRSLRASSFCALSSTVSPAEKVQQLLQFLFEDAAKHLSPSDLSHLSALTSFSLTTNTRCIRCSCVKSEGTDFPFLKITYPNGDPSFCSLLEKSMNARKSRQAECAECETTTRIEDTLRVRNLPPLLFFDANPTTSNYGFFWKNMLTKCERRPKYANPPQEAERSERACRWGDDCRNRSSCKYAHGSAVEWEEECSRWMEEGPGTWSHYIPQRFYARISGGIAALQEKEHENDKMENHAYDLVAAVCVVSDDASIPSWKYVVAECLEKWNAEGTPDAESAKTWLIINGIAICRVSKDEALHMDHRWKMPLVLVYAEKSSLVMTADESRMAIPLEVFSRDSSLTGNDDLVKERRLLDLPQKGDIVGIDAEFISMSKDGSKKCVGRVSVVDASGEQIIMDDYIAGIDGEVVHDYLTQYSGIMEHDLCRLRSKKHLTTLKATYIKVLHLIERGVIFVGHALFNDFSMLNIHVPSEQVRDTVQLFRLPQQRLISLQFLAFHLLDLKIQESTHDSVEDARVSLQLFRKWQQLQEAGTLDSTIRWLYEEGKSTNWRLSSNSLPINSSRASPTTPTKEGTPGKEDSPPISDHSVTSSSL